MRKLRLLIVICAGLVTAASPAAASSATTRADGYYEIWCRTAPGDTYLAKVVDERADQLEKNPGGKDTATEKFNENNPFGEHCIERGPFGS
jgi:hypothetical protein